MSNIKRKKAWKNIFESKPVLAFLAIIVLAFAWSVMGFFLKMQGAIERKEISENQFAELKEKKEKLSSDIAKLKTDEGVEESIREKFGLAKEGEGLIVIVEDKNSADAIEAESGGLWSFLKNLFK